MFVPVKTKDGEVLMPMHAARARKLVQRGEATPFGTMVSTVSVSIKSLLREILKRLLWV